MKVKKLIFDPFFGLSSYHLQIIVSAFIPCGKPPPSIQWIINVGNDDRLSCEVSTPPNWQANDKTVVLVHGFTGSHESSYMIRMARKLYNKKNRVVRVNLRGCGSGKGLSKLLYNAGNSEDLLIVLKLLKAQTPLSEIILVGFSLGGNISLKFGGEYASQCQILVEKIIAICPPFNLENSVLSIQERKNFIYHQHFLKGICKQSGVKQEIQSIYEFDDKFTGPSWGFSGAKEYYMKSSSKYFIDKILVPCYILCAEDDPFVSLNDILDIRLPDNVHLWTTRYGGHVGFIGRKQFQWLDNLLLQWIENCI